MAEFVKLNPSELKFLHEQNPDLVSYNVEFAEVTGGLLCYCVKCSIVFCNKT